MTRAPVSTRAGWRLVLACAALCAGIGAAVVWKPHPAALAIALCLALAALAVLRLPPARHANAPLLLLVLVLAGGIRGATVAAGASDLLPSASGHAVVLTGTVRDGTGARRNPSQVVVDVDHVVSGDVESRVHGGVLASLRRGGPELLPGDRVEIQASSLRAPRSSGAEGLLPREGVDAVAVSPALTLESHGSASPRRVLAVVRTRLAGVVDAALPEPAAGLVDALVLGIARPLPTDLADALRDSGLAHLLAVSGLKVVVVAGLVSALCAALAASPRTRLLLTAAVVGGYVVLCGAGPAAVRSAIMAGAAWSLYGTGRRTDPLPLLAATASAMLLVDPQLCRDVGFQLSFLGTLGIVLFADRIARRLPGPRILRDPFAVTVSAQVVTFPVMASTFGVVSLVGPVANALAVPLLPPLLAAGLLGAATSLVLPWLGALLLDAGGLLALLVAGIARWTAGLPFAAVHVSAWPAALILAELSAIAVALFLWHAARRIRSGDGRPRRAPSRRLVAALCCTAGVATAGTVMVAAARPDGRLHVAVLDVGAATAVAVETSDGSRALVDAGGDGQHLVQSLGAALPALAHDVGLLVLTGGDRTVAGGLGAVLDRYAVHQVLATRTALTGSVRSVLASAAARDTRTDVVPPDAAWTWGGARWRLLSTADDAAPATALTIEDGGSTVLVLGPSTTPSQEELAGDHPQALHAGLLIAPPGGAVAPALLAAVRPSFVAVPAARGSRASAALLTGPAVRRTGDDGTLTYVALEGGFTAA